MNEPEYKDLPVGVSPRQLEATNATITQLRAALALLGAECRAARARLTDAGFAYVTVGPESLGSPNHEAYARSRLATDSSPTAAAAVKGST